MIWNLMLFVVHVAAMLGFIYLFKSAPCWMQKVSVGLWIFAMLAIAAGYGIEFVGDALPHWGWWGGDYVKTLGLVIGHIALLFYMFRLIYQQHLPRAQGETQKWAKSSAHFPA